MTKMKIDGTGTNGNAKDKRNLSKRAVKGKLDTIKERCKYCGHNKLFTGNNLGLNIIKCCKCKRRQNNE